jgi:hypothetical protein
MSRPNNPVTLGAVQEIGNLFLSVTGGFVFYVGTAAQLASLGDAGAGIAGRLYSSVNAALAVTVSGRGDIIYCLPGYTESIAGANAWSNGTASDVSIVGMGHGTNRPTFTWTATTSQIAITNANFAIQNCILNLAGTASTSTVKAIVSTAAGTVIDSCYIIAGAAGGAQVATIAIEYGTGADKAVFSNNEMNSPTDAANVSCLKIVAAIDRFRMFSNIIDVGMSATTNGVVTMTVAPTNVRIGGPGPLRNILRNGIASSTKALVGITAATGYVENNLCLITNATGAATAAGTLGSLQLDANVGVAGGAVTSIAIGTGSS